MKSRFPIFVEYVAACVAKALALGTAIAFKHSHGLTDFIAVATSLAGLITIITVIPGLVFGIIYWLFAWLIVTEQRIAKARRCVQTPPQKAVRRHRPGLPGFTMMWYPVIKLSTSSVGAATDALFNK
jgi:hypothetical protein